ncbi:MAG: response regulator [Acidobacteria bacterium]|nr:response regulator [Acidobacteriota bacterium]
MPPISAVLVHNQPDPLGGLKPALEIQSVVIRRAHSCREAGRLLEGPNPPLLVFTDSQLPDGTWADVVRLAGKAPTPASVIVVSRLVDVQLYLDALEYGAFDFIAPPFEPRELAHVVECAVANTLSLRGAQTPSAASY